MPIATETSKVRYLFTGVTTFDFSFKVNSTSHIKVIRATSADVQTELIEDTDYTVALNDDGTGTVTYEGTQPSGGSLTIYREVPYTQLTDFGNQGGFFPENHTDAHDYGMMALQQLAEQVGRCPKVSITSGETGDELIETITDAVAATQTAQGITEGARDEAVAAKDIAEAAAEDIEDFLGNVVLHTHEATATAGQTYVDVTGFVLAADLDNLACYIDGVKQAKSTLTRTSGTRLTLGGALVGGEKIEIISASFSPDAASEAAAQAALAAASADSAEDAKDAAEAAAASVPSITRATFTNASLSTGKLTVTHNKGLSAPYSLIVKIFDNNSKEIVPDGITGSANSHEIDLTTYGTLTGTWGYLYQ